MRLHESALAILLPSAALFASGTAGAQGQLPATSSAPSPATATATTAKSPRAIHGRTFGGQQPVTGSTIALYTYGNSGYGSSGTLLASAITDSNGNFTIDPASIVCPSASTPVYILSVDGNPQIGKKNENNTAIAMGAGLGTCGNAANAYVVINEISTAALAYSLSHFFSAANPGNDSITNDHFGGPADNVNAVNIGNNGTIPTLMSVATGYPNSSSSTVTLESAKLYTLANILAACINSTGAGSSACTKLFNNSNSASGTAPTNTLEAAVNIAQNPTQSVTQLFNLQPTDGTQAFTGGLTTIPNDWTIAVGYTAPALGLSVDNRTVSTIDIDPNGNVWFPSNLPGAVGVAYFSPLSSTFSPLFTAPGMVHPQQVVIDSADVVWASDTQSPSVSGFTISNPGAPTTVSLAGYTSTSLTVLDDGSLRVGVLNTASARPSLASITGENTYAATPNTTVPNSRDLGIVSLAGDLVGGSAVAATDLFTTGLDALYYDNGYTHVVNGPVTDAGQVVFTANDYINTRGGYMNQQDGLCIYSARTCYPMVDRSSIRHPSGLSIDGASSLWLADQNTGSVEQVPLTSSSYLNANNHVLNQVYLHDGNNGGTMTSPTGIAVDNTGNVWVSNFGCNTTGCTPTSFVLSEVVGAGTPTITPISAQVVGITTPGTEPQFRKAKTKKK